MTSETKATDTTAPDALLLQLQELETELHHPGGGVSQQRLEQLLHPSFHEVGRSGRRYSREMVVRYLAEHPEPTALSARDFALERLGPDLALLTYRSTHAPATEASQTPSECLRSSIWVQTADGWLLRYHQGTAAAPSPTAPSPTAPSPTAP